MIWNKCDICGKFIALRDFWDGKAIRRPDDPDSYHTRETWETICARCKADGKR